MIEEQNFRNRARWILIVLSVYILSYPGHPAAAETRLMSRQEAVSSQDRLSSILEKTGQYCVQLKRAALNFVCLEEITEIINYFGPPDLGLSLRVRRGRSRKSYLYDYQVIQSEGRLEETRKLVKERGRKVRAAETELKTRRFKYKHVILGPVGLLSPSSQDLHDFRILGEETVNGEKAVAVEAVPKPGVRVDHLYGKVWVRASDSSVLKIEWRPESLGDYEEMVKAASSCGYEPRITMISEYGFEKNGIRFPSKYVISENYAKTSGREHWSLAFLGGKPLPVSETAVAYKEYKFFTVQTDVTIK